MAHKPRGCCGSPDHGLTRRRFLGTSAVAASTALAADMSVLSVLQEPLLADEIKRQDKRVILLWLAGGASQLETWDPKPGRPTGGPFRAIDTSVPGIRISELLPKLAQRQQHTAIIRSLNTKNADHGGGTELMETGRPKEAGLAYPDLGAMLARELGQADSEVPDYVSMYTSTEGRHKGGPGFLGARYAPMFLDKGLMPENIHRLESITDLDHRERLDLRNLLSARFARSRENAAIGSHNSAYGRVRGLMASDKLFDISLEPRHVRDKYGPTQFGEQALAARRLIEAGVPFVKVARAWWDSHGQNFETHLELASDLDHVMSTLLDDLALRGLLENTLVITLGEFGRTPQINPSLGRDHFASAWSATLSGCGIKGGTVYGKTDEDGHKVVDGEIGAEALFATIFNALGIDHQKDYHLGARPIPLTNPGTKPVAEVLA
ncbi:MAG: hypothetical protein B7Z73_10500 [Planctomycetia bacterium 21-64-5]|nr:MAG: hypothetical protein B7Z73_10500 [Planctomycetia bacterium 21-64-5]